MWTKFLKLWFVVWRNFRMWFWPVIPTKAVFSRFGGLPTLLLTLTDLFPSFILEVDESLIGVTDLLTSETSDLDYLAGLSMLLLILTDLSFAFFLVVEWGHEGLLSLLTSDFWLISFLISLFFLTEATLWSFEVSWQAGGICTSSSCDSSTVLLLSSE